VQEVLIICILNAFQQTFFSIHIDQYNVDTDLFDTAAVDYIFLVPAENAPYFTWTRYDDMCDLPGADIKFDITYITKTFTIPDIYNFFFPKLTNAHIITLNTDK
jgi:peroxiredoxin